jgi:hypothetical protein
MKYSPRLINRFDGSSEPALFYVNGAGKRWLTAYTERGAVPVSVACYLESTPCTLGSLAGLFGFIRDRIDPMASIGELDLVKVTGQ